MKILIAALVFVLLLSCITNKKDYSMVNKVPPAHEMTQTEVVISD